MDDESLNGDKSIMSMEEDASGAGSPSPSPWPEHPTQSIKEERHPEETATATASTEESETTNDVHSTNLKRRRPADGSHSRGSESSESGVGGVGGIDASAHPAAALVASQPNLLSADLLQSLQYFALLRQSLPTNGSLMSLPMVPHSSRTQVSPPLIPPTKAAVGLNHSCQSCGISFSSVSTLSAHVTYYCSKRPKSKAESYGHQPEACNGRSQSPDLPDPATDDQCAERPPAPKIRRSGRYYACPYCSFSADKRVSLNRHMRVHVGLPLLATHPVSPPLDPVNLNPSSATPLHADPPSSVSPPHLHRGSKEGSINNDFASAGAAAAAAAGSSVAERYCVECKIQFSSFKTFKVHKQHYCQFRKTPSASAADGSPTPVAPATTEVKMGASSTDPSTSARSPMTILVLPTHPPIVIPFCILQSARLLTAEQPMPPHSVIVSPHGEIQFRSDSPEESASKSAENPEENERPPRSFRASGDDEALDLSSKASDDPAGLVPDSNGAEASASGQIRIREELAHVQSSPNPAAAAAAAANPAAGGGRGGTTPTLPFLPPKVFAELEALGMCLGVPSGHEMSSNPAQWLAMLENAVLQAQRPSSAIPCEECSITFRRMESYLVHKQYYCAARHNASGSNPSGGNKEATNTSPPPPPAPPAATGDSSEDSPPPRPSAKVACVQCGVEFESMSTLQTHRMFYCSKRDASGAPGGDKLNHAHLIAEARKMAEAAAKTPSTTPSLATPSTPSTNNGAGGSTVQPVVGGGGGWKCPCCETVSPTAAAAQKHVETHSNVRAFRCTVCGYRGNTLRGMRTHVRIHFDRRNADLCEDNYISCIMGADFNPQQPIAGSAGTPSSVPRSPADVDQIFKSLGLAPEVCAKVLSNPAESGSAGLPSGFQKINRDLTGSSLAGLQFLQLAQRIANHSPGPTTGAGCRSDKLFLCDLCCYSSSYRGNVIRHSKLVHGREITDVAVVSSNFLQQQSPKSSSAATNPLLSDAVRMIRTGVENHNSWSGESPPMLNISKFTPSVRMSSSPDEDIQVKIDPDDVLPSPNGSHSQSSASSPDLPEEPSSASERPEAGIQKHCKSCNITFTYMSTFLAHKKYYCSSHTTPSNHAPNSSSNSEATPPPRPASQQATPA